MKSYNSWGFHGEEDDSAPKQIAVEMNLNQEKSIFEFYLMIFRADKPREKSIKINRNNGFRGYSIVGKIFFGSIELIGSSKLVA